MESDDDDDDVVGNIYDEAEKFDDGDFDGVRRASNPRNSDTLPLHARVGRRPGGGVAAMLSKSAAEADGDR